MLMVMLTMSSYLPLVLFWYLNNIIAKHILEDLILMYRSRDNVVYRKTKQIVFVTFCSALF